jgi:hypothetical protein
VCSLQMVGSAIMMALAVVVVGGLFFIGGPLLAFGWTPEHIEGLVFSWKGLAAVVLLFLIFLVVDQDNWKF